VTTILPEHSSGPAGGLDAPGGGAQGASASTPQTRPPLSPAAVVAQQRRRRRSIRRLLVVGVVLACALGFLAYKMLTSALEYFETANQAVAHRALLGNSTFQIEGVVVPGTVVHATGSDIVRFVIVSDGVHVPVTNTGLPTQLFKPGVPVVLVGHFVGTTDAFASDQILVKHSNSYVAEHPGRISAAIKAGGKASRP